MIERVWQIFKQRSAFSWLSIFSWFWSMSRHFYDHWTVRSLMTLHSNNNNNDNNNDDDKNKVKNSDSNKCALSTWRLAKSKCNVKSLEIRQNTRSCLSRFHCSWLDSLLMCVFAARSWSGHVLHYLRCKASYRSWVHATQQLCFDQHSRPRLYLGKSYSQDSCISTFDTKQWFRFSGSAHRILHSFVVHDDLPLSHFPAGRYCIHS